MITSVSAGENSVENTVGNIGGNIGRGLSYRAFAVAIKRVDGDSRVSPFCKKGLLARTVFNTFNVPSLT